MARPPTWIERPCDMTFRVPPWFNENLFNAVLVRLGEGETVRAIAKDMGFHKGTFWRICEDNAELAARYARAREVQAHDQFERIVQLAQMTENGEIDPQAARVAIDARKWAACKLMPKKYGEKIEVDQKVTVEAGESILALLSSVRAEREALPVQPVIEIGDAKPAESEEW